MFYRVKGSLIYKNGEPVESEEDNFPHGSEVTFNCIESILGEKTTWKIICEDGSWIGISLSCGKVDFLLPIYRTDRFTLRCVINLWLCQNRVTAFYFNGKLLLPS